MKTILSTLVAVALSALAAPALAQQTVGAPAPAPQPPQEFNKSLAPGADRPGVGDVQVMPEGMVALHYHRADGNYDGWNLHTWESFQSKSDAGDEFAKKQMNDRPLEGVTWFKPMPPTGKDTFGVYWFLKEKDFENGRVNYIIHKGDKKDQCNKDMFWVIKEGKQAWVVSGDCKVYLNRVAAEAAQKK
jgi:hypothetical protein